MSSFIRNSPCIVHKTCVKITTWGGLFDIIVHKYAWKHDTHAKTKTRILYHVKYYMILIFKPCLFFQMSEKNRTPRNFNFVIKHHTEFRWLRRNKKCQLNLIRFNFKRHRNLFISLATILMKFSSKKQTHINIVITIR